MPIVITGADVKSLRDKTGVTQAELARHLGYHKSNISKWEHKPTKSIPRAQYQRVLDYMRSRYDLATGQRIQLDTLLQRAVNG